MGHHLNQWISLLVIDRPFESLRELLLKEQFLFVVLRDLSVFMRQHKPEDDDDVFLTCQRLSLMIVFLQEVREFKGNSHALTKFHRLYQNMVSRRGLRLLFLVLLVVVLASYATRLVLSLVIALWDMGSRNMSKPQSSRIPPVLGNCAVVMDKTSQVQTCSMGKEVAMLHCGCNVPVIASACMEYQDEGCLPLMVGYIGECPVTVLPDSGCNGVVVRRSS